MKKMKKYNVTIDISPEIITVDANDKEDAINRAIKTFRENPNLFHELDLSAEEEYVEEEIDDYE